MTDQVNSVTLQEEWNAVNPNGTTPVAPSDKKKETGFDPFHFDPDMVKHLTYEYIVMRVLDAVGISQVSDEIKKVADLQKLEDTIHSTVNDIGKLIQQLTNASSSGKYQIDWADFMKKNSALLDKVKDEWSQLFGTDGSTESYMAQWKTMLGSDSDNPAYKMVEDLSTGSLETTWGTKGFTDWLNGKGSEDGLRAAFSSAYTASAEYHDPAFPAGKDGYGSKPDHDPLGDTTGSITSTASTVGGLTNSNSTRLTQDSQELTSYVQIGQKILSTTDSLKSDMARNQRQ